jgi:hypothetical protein
MCACLGCVRVRVEQAVDPSSPVATATRTLDPSPSPRRYMVVVCLLRADSFEKQGLLEYNFRYIRNAILDVFAIQ